MWFFQLKKHYIYITLVECKIKKFLGKKIIIYIGFENLHVIVKVINQQLVVHKSIFKNIL
jgi:hypothetical protein